MRERKLKTMTTEPMAKKNRMAIMALVLAICGLLLPLVAILLTSALQTQGLLDAGLGKCSIGTVIILWGFGYLLPPLLGLVSVVLACVALQRIHQYPDAPGKHIAMTALIVGCMAMAFAVILWSLILVHL